MPTVDANFGKWDDYDWRHGGEEWSLPWGTAAFQWAITIYPRLMAILPATSVVEIAPGFGRWLPFLLGHCQTYLGVDISPACIEYCQRTFGRLPQRPRFHVGDGLTLPGIEPATVDLVFSFDSLVHVELDCLTAYAAEIMRILRPGGHAFLHHANIGEYSSEVANLGWRGHVSAADAAQQFIAAGLHVLWQEKLPWVFGGVMTDCFSLLRRPTAGEVAALGQQYITADFDSEYKLAARMASRCHVAT